jgi:hypothetical protein
MGDPPALTLAICSGASDVDCAADELDAPPAFPLEPVSLVPAPPELPVRGTVDSPVEFADGDDELQAAVIIANTAMAESTPARPNLDCMTAS